MRLLSQAELHRDDREGLGHRQVEKLFNRSLSLCQCVSKRKHTYFTCFRCSKCDTRYRTFEVLRTLTASPDEKCGQQALYGTLKLNTRPVLTAAHNPGRSSTSPWSYLNRPVREFGPRFEVVQSRLKQPLLDRASDKQIATKQQIWPSSATATVHPLNDHFEAIETA